MAKQYPPLPTILLSIAALLLFMGYWGYGGMFPGMIAFAIVAGAGIMYYKNSYPTSGIMVLVIIVLIAIVPGFNYDGIVGSSVAVPTLSTAGTPDANEQPATLTGEPVQAAFNFYPSAWDYTAFNANGKVYLLDPSNVEDRYAFMKKFADGKQNTLTLNGQSASELTLTAASGKFNKPQLTGKIGDSFQLCGYQDTGPAAAENVSWCKSIKLTGITGGSTPEWMFSGGEFNWYKYGTVNFHDSSDTVRTVYVENQASAIEKHFTTYVFPSNNGEQITDAYLYLEIPSTNAGAISQVTITNMQTGEVADYTSITPTTQIATSDPAFLAAPGLSSSSNTMYAVGAFPGNTVRTSTSDLGKFTVDVRYTHAASASDVAAYLSGVQNYKAKTTANGHIDFAAKIALNMSTTGTTGWT